METEKVFIKNPNLFISRIKKNHYKIDITVENKNLFMEKILNFNLIKLIFEINKSNFEECRLEDNENGKEANIYLLVKPLFKELGFFQRYISLHLTKFEENGTMQFLGVAFPEYGQTHNKCKNAIAAPIKEMPISSFLYNPNKMTLSIQIILEDTFEMTALFEKIFISLLKTNNLQFIEFLEKL